MISLISTIHSLPKQRRACIFEHNIMCCYCQKIIVACEIQEGVKSIIVLYKQLVNPTVSMTFVSLPRGSVTHMIIITPMLGVALRTRLLEIILNNFLAQLSGLLTLSLLQLLLPSETSSRLWSVDHLSPLPSQHLNIQLVIHCQTCGTSMLDPQFP